MSAPARQVCDTVGLHVAQLAELAMWASALLSAAAPKIASLPA